jgi:glutamyl-tRNA synthetase
VVRGDDLLTSAPRQAHLAALLGYPEPVYAHVPLALNTDGKRLAKRDGAVTLGDLGTERALALISASLGRPGATPAELLVGFDPTALPREAWVYDASRTA